uniref:Uncharacterized protein n=1 Tax=Alexandrium monilatum TaxID=311494 RepID=A0A7S4S1L9_9DINO
MAAAHSRGGFSQQMEAMSQLSLQDMRYAARQSLAAREELNLLVKNGTKRAEDNRESNWFGEDGFLPDDEDPLVHVTQEMEERLPPAVHYEVVFKRIAIRRRPSEEGKVFGTAVMGEKLATYSWDETGKWRQIHFRLLGGWGSKVVAWVMVSHPQLGVLIRPEGGQAAEAAPTVGLAPVVPLQAAAEQRETTPAAKAGPLPVGVEELEEAARELEELRARHGSAGAGKKDKKVSELELLRGATPEESEDEEEVEPLTTVSPEGFTYATVEELDEGAESGGIQYQVVHKPFVAIRHQAIPKGKVVNSMEYGEYIDTFGWDTRRKWRKLFCRMPDGRIIVAWMMTEHPELGILLEPAAG